MKIKLIMAIALVAVALWGSTSCIYMDARTGCNEVRVNYDLDAAYTSGAIAPSLDYHREGVGSTNENAAKQDAKQDGKLDLKMPVVP